MPNRPPDRRDNQLLEDLLRHGVACLNAGRDAEAAEIFGRAAQAVPGLRLAHAGLGNALQRLGRPAEAVAAYERAVACDPADADSLCNLGNAFLALKRYEAAEAAFVRAVAIRPGWVAAETGRGVALEGAGDLDAAIAVQRRILAAHPDAVLAAMNLARCLAARGDYDAAIAVLDTPAAAASPRAVSSLAAMLGYRGDVAASLARHRAAVAAAPDDPVVHNNYASQLLTEGDFAAGWREYEWRWRLGGAAFRPRGYDRPLWTGAPLAGRTLLLHTEQGFGDTFQFVRFAARLPTFGGRVVLRAPRPQAAVLAGVVGLDAVTADDLPPPHDVVLPLLSLPAVLDLASAADLAMTAPYLHADAERLRDWRSRIGGDGLRVGIAWAGSLAHPNDAARSLAAADLIGGLRDCGARVFSLQRDVRPGDDAVLAAHADAITDLGPELRDFSDTAAAVAALDLVICVDTALAHLAGGLGKPVWVMLPHVADWRWLRGRADSPWYPTMRLFRQDRPCNWTGVIAAVAAALAEVRRA